MSSDGWKKAKLGDLGEIVGGGTPSTKNNSYYNGDISWITPKDLSTRTERYIFRGERMITKSGLASSSAKLMPINTILFSSRAPIGYIAIAGKEVCTNQGFKNIVPKEGVSDSMFLYYLLKYKKQDIESVASGTTFMEVSGSAMKNFSVTIPLIDEQKAIAAILSCLDDKIELNNKMNKTLEEMAKAIFKSWFVDFEPFQDGEFEDSELGRIPKGWRVVELGECVTIIDNRGKTPPLSSKPTPYPIIDVKALSGESRIINYDNCTKYVDEDTYRNWFRNGHPFPQDILVSTVGSLAEMKVFYGNKGCIAQNVVGFRSKNVSSQYLYQYLQYIKSDLVSYNIGSVQPSIKVTHIIKHRISIPSNDVLTLFNSTAKKISEVIFKNCEENETLTAVRDTLLPKLMSGEIRVPIEEV